jgi:hypothetical protein
MTCERRRVVRTLGSCAVGGERTDVLRGLWRTTTMTTVRGLHVNCNSRMRPVPPAGLGQTRLRLHACTRRGLDRAARARFYPPRVGYLSLDSRERRDIVVSASSWNLSDWPDRETRRYPSSPPKYQGFYRLVKGDIIRTSREYRRCPRVVQINRSGSC